MQQIYVDAHLDPGVRSSRDQERAMSPPRPHSHRVNKNMKSLENSRNNRIIKTYGVPCPYKQPPITIDYSRPINPNTSQDRDYIPPITKSSNMNTYSSYEDIILGDKRPSTASRLKFNDSNLKNSDVSDKRGNQQRRPASSSAYMAHKKSPRKIKLILDRPKSSRYASVQLEPDLYESSAYELDPDLSDTPEDKAFLEISAALIDTRRKDKKHITTEHKSYKVDDEGGGGGGGGSYYEEIREDLNDEVTYGDEDEFKDNNRLKKSIPATSRVSVTVSVSGPEDHLVQSSDNDDDDNKNNNPKRAERRNKEKSDANATSSNRDQKVSSATFNYHPKSSKMRNVEDIDILHLRKIVPNYDKNFLRARPPPSRLKLSESKSRPPRSGAAAVGVKDRLKMLGLFTYPASVDMNNSFDELKVNKDIEIEIPLNQSSFLELSVASQQQKSSSPAPRPRPVTAGVRSSDQKTSSGYANRLATVVRDSNINNHSNDHPGSNNNKHQSSEKKSARASSASAGREGSNKVSHDVTPTPDPDPDSGITFAKGNKIVPITRSPVKSMGAGGIVQANKYELDKTAINHSDEVIPKSEKTNVTFSTTAKAAISASKETEEHPAPGNDSFVVGRIIQARYKGRPQWWVGKIIHVHTPAKGAADKTVRYDIRYGDIVEKSVPADRIRTRQTKPLHREEGLVKTGTNANSRGQTKQREGSQSKLIEEGQNKMKEGGESELKEEGESKLKEEIENKLREESAATGQQQIASVSTKPAPHPPPLHGSQKLSPDKKENIFFPLHLTNIEERKAPFSPNLKPSFLSALNSGDDDGGVGFRSPLEGLKKTIVNQKSAETIALEEKARVEKLEREKREQERLQKELTSIIHEYKRNISYADITFEKIIGRGKFASVHKVTYDCKTHSSDRGRVNNRPDNLQDVLSTLEGNTSADVGVSVTLAVKTPEYKNAHPLYSVENIAPSIETDTKAARYSDLTTLASSVQIVEVIREVKALQSLSHQNIINFYGVALVPRICVALELLDYNLSEVITSPPDALKVPLDTHQRVYIIREICCGLKYMHEKRYAHLDIKPHNILLHITPGGYTVKIADLGTAEYLQEGQVLTEPVGTSGYTAPEVSLPGRYNMTADIFSFAIVMWEVLVQKHGNFVKNPFAGKALDEAACDTHGGIRPSLDCTCEPLLNETVTGAWATAPVDRLSLDIIYKQLTEILYG